MTVQTFRSPPADSWATKENKQMKKLIVAAAIVCAAACSQAAYYTWGLSQNIDNWEGNAPKYNGNPLYEGGKIYLYLGTIGYTEGEGFDLSSATLVTSGDFNSSLHMYGNNNWVFSSSNLVKANGGQDYTLILTGDGKSFEEIMTNGGHFVLRTGTSESISNDMITYASFIDYNKIVASDWTTYGAIPEPTSGLLLLLGMAGLALKRKRA